VCFLKESSLTCLTLRLLYGQPKPSSSILASSRKRPGDRRPFATFHENNELINIQDKVKAPAFQRLLFLRNSSDEKIKAIHDLVDQYNDVIQIQRISFAPGSNDLFEIFGVQNGGYYLVRPDMYVAYRSNTFNQTTGKRF
jgi:hypothetical protein